MSRLLVENIRHEDASTDALVLDNSGNISIPGTLSTGSRVGVNQTPAANNFALQVTGVTNNGTDGRAVLIKGSNASTTIGGAGPNLAIQNTDSTANNVTKLSFETASAGEAVSINSINTNHSSFYGDLAINTRGAGGYSEKMRVMADGNVGIGTTNPFAKSHIKDTGWSSGSPYGTVALIEGNNVNDNNWGHLVITDTTTANGNGGSIRFATGASSALNPFSGIQGAAEGASWGGIGFETRPQGGTATRRLTIDSIGTVGIGTSDLDNWSAVFDGRVRLGATGFVGTTSASTQLGNNWLYNGSAYLRLTNDYALRYYQNGGDHVWETAVSDAADSTITWSTKMLLQETGYLDLTSDSQIRLTLGSEGTPGTNTANWIRGTSGNLGLNAASGNIHFEIGGSEIASLANSNFQVSAGAPTITLNANSQASGKKKVRLAASQATAGDFHIQSMADDGTTVNSTPFYINTSGISIPSALQPSKYEPVIKWQNVTGGFTGGCSANTFYNITNFNVNNYGTPRGDGGQGFIYLIYWTSGNVNRGYHHTVTGHMPQLSANAHIGYQGGSYATSAQGANQQNALPIQVSHHTGCSAGHHIQVRVWGDGTDYGQLQLQIRAEAVPNGAGAYISVWKV